MKGGYSHKSVLPYIPHELKKIKSARNEEDDYKSRSCYFAGDSGIVPPQFVLLSKDHNIASLQQSTQVQVQPRSYTRKKDNSSHFRRNNKYDQKKEGDDEMDAADLSLPQILECK
ncbi:hypothetical protein HA466_0113660 [Hirschfeldia incana]|nr:hypothetical protein HA466_0113660 [Hirschfeldia incana]